MLVCPSCRWPLRPSPHSDRVFGCGRCDYTVVFKGEHSHAWPGERHAFPERFPPAEPSGRGKRAVELTGRELEMLMVSSEGLSKRQVGERLGVSRETVASLLARARLKLGARSVAEAVTVARERGLL
jgi:DNA-binding CsgD family transcriptional regulator